jgi:hypothetical protein
MSGSGTTCSEIGTKENDPGLIRLSSRSSLLVDEAGRKTGTSPGCCLPPRFNYLLPGGKPSGSFRGGPQNSDSVVTRSIRTIASSLLVLANSISTSVSGRRFLPTSPSLPALAARTQVSRVLLGNESRWALFSGREAALKYQPGGLFPELLCVPAVRNFFHDDTSTLVYE